MSKCKLCGAQDRYVVLPSGLKQHHECRDKDAARVRREVNARWNAAYAKKARLHQQTFGVVR